MTIFIMFGPKVSFYKPLYVTVLTLLFLLIAHPSRIKAQESAADKAKREELIRKNAQIEAQNRKNTASNAIVMRTFTAGNEALMAGRYDEAIAQYNEGLTAQPEQTALWINKSNALRQRGVARYNAAIKSSDEATKKAGVQSAGVDWREAFTSASQAVSTAKAEPTTPVISVRAAHEARAEAGRLLVRFDPSAGDAVFQAYQEYITVEVDEGKKIKARNDAAQVLVDAGLAERAVTEFRKLVNENSYNVDAILGLGMALFTTGDRSRFKEAATYLQQFVKVAPDTHAKKPWARQTLRELEGYVKPDK